MLVLQFIHLKNWINQSYHLRQEEMGPLQLFTQQELEQVDISQKRLKTLRNMDTNLKFMKDIYLKNPMSLRSM
jgi:hypothetical protein